MVTSGDASALTNVTMTLTWANRSWLAQALGAALIGMTIAALALTDLKNRRPAAGRTDDRRTTTTSKVTV